MRHNQLPYKSQSKNVGRTLSPPPYTQTRTNTIITYVCPSKIQSAMHLESTCCLSWYWQTVCYRPTMYIMWDWHQQLFNYWTYAAPIATYILFAACSLQHDIHSAEWYSRAHASLRVHNTASTVRECQAVDAVCKSPLNPIISNPIILN